MLTKRSFSLNGSPTSIALEPEFHAIVGVMAADAGLTVTQFLCLAAEKAGTGNLASCLRVSCLTYLTANGRGKAIDKARHAIEAMEQDRG